MESLDSHCSVNKARCQGDHGEALGLELVRKHKRLCSQTATLLVLLVLCMPQNTHAHTMTHLALELSQRETVR